MFPILSNTDVTRLYPLQHTDNVGRKPEARVKFLQPVVKTLILLSTRSVLDRKVFSSGLPSEVLTFRLLHRSCATTLHYPKLLRNSPSALHQQQVHIGVWICQRQNWCIFFPSFYTRAV